MKGRPSRRVRQTLSPTDLRDGASIQDVIANRRHPPQTPVASFKRLYRQ